MADPLPTGYYLDNFNQLLEFVEQQYADLLTDEEQEYAASFRRLSLGSRRLYVRLVSRRGPLFRSDRLAYAEIPELEPAWRELNATGYLDFAEEAQVTEVLDLCTRAELLALLEAGAALPRAVAKPELLVRAAERFSTAELRARLPFEVLRPLRLEHLELYNLLFFGNLNQDLTEFVLTDLGLLTYEQYPLSLDARAFDSRGVVERVVHLRRLAEEAAEAIEAADADALETIAARVPEALLDEVVRRRTDRLLNRIARELERRDRAERAFGVYARAAAPPSRERRCRILERAGRCEEALVLAEAMGERPIDEEELELARRFVPRLRKRLGMARPSDGARKATDVAATELVRLPFRADQRVEERVREHLGQAGGQVYYVENHLFLGLFGLVFWDAVFAPVRGAFFNRFQSGPADLWSPGFRAARAGMIESLLAEVQTNHGWRERVRDTYARKLGIANPFVHWQMLTPDLLDLALLRIPAEHAHPVFERLLWDLRNHRSGFPDLVVFPDAADYELVEVKGPGDRLQANQRRWMAAFERIAMPVRVINVEWT